MPPPHRFAEILVRQLQLLDTVAQIVREFALDELGDIGFEVGIKIIT